MAQWAYFNLVDLLLMPSPESAAENAWRPRVTVACVVVDRGRYLMVEELIRGERLFNQPAGHLDPGETLAEAARRETLEETGWEIELQSFIGVQQWLSPLHRSQIVRFAFAARPLRHHPDRPLDAGIVGTHWLDYMQIAALGERLRSPLVLTALHDWLGGQRLPLTALRSLLPHAEG
ncbi:MAG: NUDIX hydrolase [Rhodanobacteraceae bacterium]